jgi:hypothetical protein
MADEIDFGEVVHRFYAGRQYGVVGPRYEDINWFDEEVAKPTIEDLTAKWEEIKDDIKQYKLNSKRSAPGEYPSRDDMIVALWEMVVEERPDFAQELQARRLEIKTKYPKE